MPKWYRGDEWSKAYAGGEPIALPTTALGGSVPTPKEGVRAEVVEVGSFEELEALGREGCGRQDCLLQHLHGPQLDQHV